MVNYCVVVSCLEELGIDLSGMTASSLGLFCCIVHI